MKDYQQPIVTLLVFCADDVIRTSGEDAEFTKDPYEDDWRGGLVQ